MAVPRLLIVVLPGIGGSMLAVPDGRGRPGETIWSAALRDVNLLKNPERLSVQEQEHLVPVGLVPTRKAFGVWTVVHGYNGVLNRLAARFGGPLDDGTPDRRNLDATIVAIGYDFRRSVAQAAEHVRDEIDERLAHLWPDKAERVDKVVVVAHSMGGLVARYWVAKHGGARFCRGLITLGTPHRGAPKALEVLANGVPIKFGHLRRPRAVLRGWEGAAELLPRYAAVLDTTVPVNAPEGRVLRYVKDLPIPWLADIADPAFRMHEDIRTGWAAIETRPALYPRIGFGHQTLRSCVWDGQRLTVTTDEPEGPALGGWATDLGDGTVPAFSGQPLELDRQPRYGLTVQAKHGPIAELAEVERIVFSFLEDPSLAPYHGEQAQSVLSLDVDDVQVAGTPIEVTGMLRSPKGPLPIAADAPSAWITVTPVREDTGLPADVPVVEEPAIWDDDRQLFGYRIPGLSPGLYELTLTAEELGGGLSSSQTVEVLSDDGLE